MRIPFRLHQRLNTEPEHLGKKILVALQDRLHPAGNRMRFSATGHGLFLRLSVGLAIHLKSKGPWPVLQLPLTSLLHQQTYTAERRDTSGRSN
jgi:hypothetical protein